jgi:hypothetical protein
MICSLALARSSGVLSTVLASHVKERLRALDAAPTTVSLVLSNYSGRNAKRAIGEPVPCATVQY